MQKFAFFTLVQVDAVQNIQKLQVVLWSLAMENREDAKVIKKTPETPLSLKEEINSFSKICIFVTSLWRTTGICNGSYEIFLKGLILSPPTQINRTLLKLCCISQLAPYLLKVEDS